MAIHLSKAVEVLSKNKTLKPNEEDH